VTLFDVTEAHPPSRIRRYVIRAVAVVVTIAVFVAVLPGYLWYPFIYYAEKNTVRSFMDAVIAGNMQHAYEIWKPSASYSFKDFLDDWGPEGYYGPVQSYRMRRPEHIKNSSAADIVVDVSPYRPFPPDDDVVKQSKTKTVNLWVDFKDHSISFPPF
jgi:hypothetical protein